MSKQQVEQLLNVTAQQVFSIIDGLAGGGGRDADNKYTPTSVENIVGNLKQNNELDEARLRPLRAKLELLGHLKLIRDSMQ